MSDLQEQFKKESGDVVFFDTHINPAYVEWLESRLNEAESVLTFYADGKRYLFKCIKTSGKTPFGSEKEKLTKELYYDEGKKSRDYFNRRGGK